MSDRIKNSASTEHNQTELGDQDLDQVAGGAAGFHFTMLPPIEIKMEPVPTPDTTLAPLNLKK